MNYFHNLNFKLISPKRIILFLSLLILFILVFENFCFTQPNWETHDPETGIPASNSTQVLVQIVAEIADVYFVSLLNPSIAPSSDINGIWIYSADGNKALAFVAVPFYI